MAENVALIGLNDLNRTYFQLVYSGAYADKLCNEVHINMVITTDNKTLQDIRDYLVQSTINGPVSMLTYIYDEQPDPGSGGGYLGQIIINSESVYFYRDLYWYQLNNRTVPSFYAYLNTKYCFFDITKKEMDTLESYGAINLSSFAEDIYSFFCSYGVQIQLAYNSAFFGSHLYMAFSFADHGCPQIGGIIGLPTGGSIAAGLLLKHIYNNYGCVYALCNTFIAETDSYFYDKKNVGSCSFVPNSYANYNRLPQDVGQGVPAITGKVTAWSMTSSARYGDMLTIKAVTQRYDETCADLKLSLNAESLPFLSTYPIETKLFTEMGRRMTYNIVWHSSWVSMNTNNELSLQVTYNNTALAVANALFVLDWYMSQ